MRLPFRTEGNLARLKEVRNVPVYRLAKKNILGNYFLLLLLALFKKYNSKMFTNEKLQTINRVKFLLFKLNYHN